MQRVLQIRVLKPKVAFNPLTPARFVIEVHVSSLFVFVRRYFGLFVSLKPSHVLFVISPTLFFQFASRQVLLVRALRVIKNKKQSVGSEFRKDVGIVQNAGRRGGVGRGGRIGIARRVGTGSFAVEGGRTTTIGLVQSAQIRVGGVVMRRRDRRRKRMRSGSSSSRVVLMAAH